jgi:hypothetical protein
MRISTFVILPAAVGLAGCLLGPLVDDDARASVHILPPDAVVPSVAEAPERVAQIITHDGLDDATLEENDGVVPRIVGRAGGELVHYWSFGRAPRVGALAYVLVEPTSHGPRPVAHHPWLLDSIPGDPGYSPIRRLQYVQVTPAYRGERLPTVRALTDAIELGLVEDPVPTGTWVNAPVVPPGTRLDVGEGQAPAAPGEAYAGGYRVDLFTFGGERGLQPLRFGQVPVGQASLLFEGSSLRAGPEPVFQWTVPAEAPVEAHNYTPLATIVEVRLAEGVSAAEILDDRDLFGRSGSGAITGVRPAVASFVVTETVRNWPQQFVEGAP